VYKIGTTIFKPDILPYLQLEVNNDYSISTKELLAKRIGQAFSHIMDADPNRITFSIRCLGVGSVRRCSNTDPTPSIDV
jgi:hypothetical protein